MNSSNFSSTTESQRKRILEFLRSQPLDTITARKELDVMHPAARVQELRESGQNILTLKIDKVSDYGKVHRVAYYVLSSSTDQSAKNEVTSSNNL